jgi:hypothetical protein
MLTYATDVMNHVELFIDKVLDAFAADRPARAGGPCLPHTGFGLLRRHGAEDMTHRRVHVHPRSSSQPRTPGPNSGAKRERPWAGRCGQARSREPHTKPWPRQMPPASELYFRWRCSGRSGREFKSPHPDQPTRRSPATGGLRISFRLRPGRAACAASRANRPRPIYPALRQARIRNTPTMALDASQAASSPRMMTTGHCA